MIFKSLLKELISIGIVAFVFAFVVCCFRGGLKDFTMWFLLFVSSIVLIEIIFNSMIGFGVLMQKFCKRLRRRPDDKEKK